MTAKQFDGLVYLIIFGVFTWFMFHIMKPYTNTKPQVVDSIDGCDIIEYKEHYFLKCS